MKKVRKIVALVSIAAFVLGGVASTASASPSQNQGAVDEGEETGKVVEGGGSCTVPTPNFLNDGLTSADVDYFNTDDQISANWDFDSNGCSIIKYQYRVVKKTGATPWQAMTGWIITTSDYATVNTPPLLEGETYLFKIKAKNSAGWSEKYKTDGQTLDMTKPQIDNFSLSQNKPYGGNVALSWSANDVGGEIDNYQIYRNGLPYQNVSEPTNSYNDTISGDKVDFNYYLKATDEAGNVSDPSDIKIATVDDIAPAAPIIDYTRSGAVITINWPAVANASTYVVYRDGAAIPVGGSLSYVDSAAKRGETHSYYAVAVDEAGNVSPASNTLVIYIPLPRVSSISTAEVLGAVTGAEQAQAQEEEGQEKADEGQVEAAENSAPEETAEEAKTNWSLIIAIIIAAAIVISGVLYWWYAREDEDEDEI